MFTHPELVADLAKQHVNEMIEEGSRHRLATALRRGRRQHWPDSRRRASTAGPASTAGNVRHAGRLASCEVVPERVAAGQAR